VERERVLMPGRSLDGCAAVAHEDGLCHTHYEHRRTNARADDMRRIVDFLTRVETAMRETGCSFAKYYDSVEVGCGSTSISVDIATLETYP
jgi:ribosomal protein L20